MKFEFKSASEIAKMTDEEAMGYKDAMNAHFVQLEKDLRAAIEAKGDKETIDSLKSDLKETADAVKAQGLEMAKKTVEVKEAVSMKDQIVKALTENKDKLVALKNDKVRFDFSVKVDTMTFANSVTGEIPQIQRLAGVNATATRQPFIASLIGSGTATSNEISWVEESTLVGDADLTAEGVKKNQMEPSFIVGSEKIRKITVFVKVSEEMLEDVDFMASYINNKLMQRVELKVDQQILNGTAGGVELNGITTQATAFAAGAFATAVDNANLFDVIKVAINQIAIANHNANYVVLHPSDAVALSLTKNVDGDYLFPTFTLPGGKTIEGLPVVTNTGVEVGHFLVMDSTKAIVYYKNNVRIEAGWESDDFVKNLRTILAEVRLALVIEGNDKTAFVYDDIAECILDINKAIA